ncbi:maltose O-acetyltransferase [Candidatus Epulonipiscium fishelsonii]|uniref:Maltose O-acetyltransferase n=1 Tax=Candidatus Epulonipiscium fishelsonii TaxID=77094 RepID=A0ACC8XCQ7_9FIRM|nr:maltose O-acetyltransferase [Epulopiscium sp. SCG-B11WGA-EpuloA1]ONI43212.1 maltose O-acetyltransferase [Epulopiscium sp. SCG-B05WGA-EpuloA1]
MTEKEKMLAGEPYDAADPELIRDRIHAKKLCQKFNTIDVTDYEGRLKILQELFQTSESFNIDPTLWVDYGYNVNLGKNFYANHNCIFLDVNTITIGENVMFAPNVQLYTATHPIDAMKRISGLEMGYPITIGDNTWIGGGTIVCPGVNIGKNVVIGAGSVVSKDIPDNVVAVGNPCKVIRNL